MSDFVFSKNHLNPFQSQLEELDSKLVPIEGEVPSKLKGTFFRIGPGRLHLSFLHKYCRKLHLLLNFCIYCGIQQYSLFEARYAILSKCP